jgi:hypothetical protein
MTDGIHEIRERQVACEARLQNLERATVEIIDEVKKLSKLLKGNGEEGVFGQLQVLSERIDGLQRQWKWILGMLAGFIVAVAQAVLRK